MFNGMIVVFLLAAVVAFILNLEVPTAYTNMAAGGLFVEFMATIILAYIMIVKMLPEKKAQARFLNSFLSSFMISLLILHFYWTPELPTTGFDPARYYNYAASLVKGQLLAEGLNYFGVVYFYYFLFSLLGLDPLIPLYLNVLLVLYACLMLANLLYRTGVPYKMSALLLLIPEIMYYNVMSSREILCMVFGVYVIINLFKIYTKEISYLRLIPTLIILALMIFIRPPYGICTILVIGIYMMFATHRKRKTIVYIVVLLVVAVVCIGAAGAIGDNGNIGSVLSSTIENRVTGENEMNDDFTYGKSSIAAKLIPHNPIEFVVFGVIRTMAYVIVPPSVILNPINSLNVITDVRGYTEWTTLLMMIYIIRVYKTVKNNFKHSEVIRLIAISFFVFFLLVGMFNINLIQQRYRVVYDMFYFSLALIYMSRYKQKKTVAIMS